MNKLRAAKLLNEPRDVIYYAITQRGPIPIELKHNDFDYDHYIEKQLKPIADSVLSLLGKNFDSIAENDQLSFFWSESFWTCFGICELDIKNSENLKRVQVDKYNLKDGLHL